MEKINAKMSHTYLFDCAKALEAEVDVWKILTADMGSLWKLDIAELDKLKTENTKLHERISGMVSAQIADGALILDLEQQIANPDFIRVPKVLSEDDCSGMSLDDDEYRTMKGCHSDLIRYFTPTKEG